jgi:hopene-associated glycosyltransferase HpnB
VHTASVVLAVLALTGAAGWLGVLLGTARAWDLRPIAEDDEEPPAPTRWPSVTALVPARNEAAVLPQTLPALLGQDYPGEWRVVVVDDRSTDGTVEAVRACGVEPVRGADLPQGWVGKMWALEQASRRAGEPDYYLLTDADIRHGPGSLRRLVAEAETATLALNSRMARLRCRSRAERLLIPPFLLFFNLLYPMRRVNDPRSRVAAAAGGCVLVRRTTLESTGGFAAVRDRLIDDVSLGRLIKASGARIRLSVSRADVVSLRSHDLGGVWRMVKRTAFTELRRSWLLLGLTIALLALLFPLPPLLLGAALGLVAPGTTGWAIVALTASTLACAAMVVVYLPTLRYFGLGRRRAATLPVAGCLYGAMTVDSALQTMRRAPASW